MKLSPELLRGLAAALGVGGGAAALWAATPDDAEAIPIGPMARTANRAALRLAQRLERQGVDASEIWARTQAEHGQGWERYHGDWTSEVPDTGFQVQGYGRGPVRNFVTHPALQEAYPDLMRARANFGQAQRTVDNPEALGWFRRFAFPWSTRMDVSNGGDRAATTIHELTHGGDFMYENRAPYDHNAPYSLRPHELRALQAEYRLGLDPEQRAALPFSATEDRARAQMFRRLVLRGNASNAETALPARARPAAQEVDFEQLFGAPERQESDWWHRERDAHLVNDQDRYSVIRPAMRGPSFMSMTEYRNAVKHGAQLPEVRDDNMIDFDAPLGDQHPHVRQVLSELRSQHGDPSPLYYRGRLPEGLNDQTISVLESKSGIGSGEVLDMIQDAARKGHSVDQMLDDIGAWSRTYYGDEFSARDKQIARTLFKRYSRNPDNAFGSSVVQEITPEGWEKNKAASPYFTGEDPKPERAHLTGKERQMLDYLRNKPDASDEELLHHLYGHMDEPELKIIQVFRNKLKRKLLFSRERELAQFLRAHGLAGGYFRAGEGMDSERSFMLFDPHGPRNPTIHGRFLRQA